MARRLFGAKPLPKPMVIYCTLVLLEEISSKFVFQGTFQSYKGTRKCCLQNDGHFAQATMCYEIPQGDCLFCET